MQGRGDWNACGQVSPVLPLGIVPVRDRETHMQCLTTSDATAMCVCGGQTGTYVVCASQHHSCPSWLWLECKIRRGESKKRRGRTCKDTCTASGTSVEEREAVGVCQRAFLRTSLGTNRDPREKSSPPASKSRQQRHLAQHMLKNGAGCSRSLVRLVCCVLEKGSHQVGKPLMFANWRSVVCRRQIIKADAVIRKLSYKRSTEYGLRIFTCS